MIYRVFQVSCMIKNRNISAPRAARSLPKTSTWSLWNPVLSLLSLNTMEAYNSLSKRPYTMTSYWQNRQYTKGSNTILLSPKHRGFGQFSTMHSTRTRCFYEAFLGSRPNWNDVLQNGEELPSVCLLVCPSVPSPLWFQPLQAPVPIRLKAPFPQSPQALGSPLPAPALLLLAPTDPPGPRSPRPLYKSPASKNA